MISDGKSIAFWFFIGAVVVYVALLSRFVRQLIRSKLASPMETEALSQLVFSGSGGVRVQWFALTYLLQRKYARLTDKKIVKAGDHALLGFCIAFASMLGWCFVAIFRS